MSDRKGAGGEERERQAGGWEQRLLTRRRGAQEKAEVES